ncbi:e3 ubiquitin ligase Rnf157 [Caerostris extrusa]|uniref:RING-type E3 ubiquitin transferase n=1 Tax=Caerostris extrusa TaxID=172846 RepID=A0AAV4UCA8_CAEEX|nr:e3 ubiquitin ligase Rnf157 [Caerostris extrusa]
MGSFFSRQNAGIEEPESTSNNAYRYPPRNGKYFASHFIMGGEKFQTTDPEKLSLWRKHDLQKFKRLNTINLCIFMFPYAAPQANEPTRTLHSLMNIRKETLRFIKTQDTGNAEKPTGENAPLNTRYNIEFYFDTNVRCNITIYYFCNEEVTPNGVTYHPQDASLNSETFHYKKGINQQFSQTSHVFDPSKYTEEMLLYRLDTEVIPILIQCVAEEGDEPKQSHMLIAIVEKNPDDSYSLKPLKQKNELADEDVEDSGFDCVICMSDPRDTMILPCRHLCLCNSCSDSLRYQANNCPICRAPFRALLQIKAVRKINNALPQISHNPENQSSFDIPPGYEAISLIEALNGPILPSAPLVPFVSAPNPPFSNSPDVRPKHRNLDRHHSSSASLKLGDNATPEKDGSAPGKLQASIEIVPALAETALISSDKLDLKTESLSLTRGEGRKHKKGFRTSSAPEKMRLLANSVNIVNEVGSKRKVEKDAELAETRSLLEGNVAAEEGTGAVCSPKPSRPCSRTSPISLSTPHSLHLCEKSSRDVSPGGDDSDYFTPEEISTTMLVDQGTDTSLDMPQTAELASVVVSDADTDKSHGLDKSDTKNADVSKKSESSLDKPTSSLPGTPASNASHHSSADSFSSTSSTRLLLRPRSYETLPE